MPTHKQKLAKYSSLAFATAVLATTPTANAQDFKVDWKGAPEIESADGNFSFKVRGRMFVDWGTVSDSSGTVADKTEVRQARIGVEGLLAGDVEYKFEVDWGQGGTEIKDAFIEWKLEPVSIMAGQFKVPVSFEEMSSTRHTLFIERAGFTDAFKFGRQVGLTANVDKNDITFIGGVYQGEFNNGNAIQGRTYAARATYATRFDGGLFHVGGSAFKRENDDTVETTIRYNHRPHLHLAPIKYIDTSAVDAASDTFIGGEFVSIYGPLNVQGEWGWMTIDAPAGGNSATFQGGYASVSYFLTGETRGYKRGMIDQAQVINPVFKGGAGAWQLAARYDVVDLTDTDAGIIGGKQTGYQFGVNWHLNNFVRIQANYVKNIIDGGIYDGEKIDVFGVRFQSHW